MRVARRMLPRVALVGLVAVGANRCFARSYTRSSGSLVPAPWRPACRCALVQAVRPSQAPVAQPPDAEAAASRASHAEWRHRRPTAHGCRVLAREEVPYDVGPVPTGRY